MVAGFPMRNLAFPLVFFAFLFPACASAQDAGDAYQGEALGEVTQEPVCFNVMNEAPYSVYGGLESNELIRPDGIKTRHREQFRLETGRQARFCTTGPFYEGGKLRLVLRSLVPLFDCYTAVTGDIVIHGERLPEGGTKTWADCL